MKQYYLYILASKKNGTLYTEVTDNLIQILYEHKEVIVNGFTKKFKVKKLVYYKVYKGMYKAIKKEKAMKNCLRKWKIEIIEKTNPEWKDLYQQFTI
jgi:putative endonuclease